MMARLVAIVSLLAIPPELIAMGPYLEMSKRVTPVRLDGAAAECLLNAMPRIKSDLAKPPLSNRAKKFEDLGLLVHREGTKCVVWAGAKGYSIGGGTGYVFEGSTFLGSIPSL